MAAADARAARVLARGVRVGAVDGDVDGDVDTHHVCRVTPGRRAYWSESTGVGIGIRRGCPRAGAHELGGRCRAGAGGGMCGLYVRRCEPRARGGATPRVPANGGRDARGGERAGAVGGCGRGALRRERRVIVRFTWNVEEQPPTGSGQRPSLDRLDTDLEAGLREPGSGRFSRASGSTAPGPRGSVGVEERRRTSHVPVYGPLRREER